MVDFIKSLHSGIAAAQSAEKNRAEIDSVFAELNRQLAQATNNTVAIHRAERHEQVDVFASIQTVFNRPKYWALMVGTPKGLCISEVARWETTESGYPCTIRMPSTVWMCVDKRGLESALSKLLQTSAVGEEIRKILAHPDHAALPEA